MPRRDICRRQGTGMQRGWQHGKMAVCCGFAHDGNSSLVLCCLCCFFCPFSSHYVLAFRSPFAANISTAQLHSTTATTQAHTHAHAQFPAVASGKSSVYFVRVRVCVASPNRNVFVALFEASLKQFDSRLHFPASTTGRPLIVIVTVIITVVSLFARELKRCRVRPRGCVCQIAEVATLALELSVEYDRICFSFVLHLRFGQ